MATQRERNIKKPTPSTPIIETRVSETAKSVARQSEPLPFGRMNYILLGVGFFIVCLGFFLMRGKFVDAKTFSIPLHVAPLVVMAGLIEIIFAIMYVPKSSSSDAE